MKQFDLFEQRKLKEKALDDHERYRAELISEAKKIAFRLAKKNGQVTSPEVVRELEKQFKIEVDKRFMGAVFRKGWKRIGFSSTGSHCQPISVWKIEE